MKIATFNVNDIKNRLPALLQWLEETQSDVACLQERKAPDTCAPERANREAGSGAILHGLKAWNGVAILARGTDPMETQRDLPGPDSADDIQSHYVGRRPPR